MLRRIRQRRDQDGFTLIEVVVAMFVFSILASASLGMVLRTAQVANNNIRRTTASNLVTAQLEAVRSQTALDIPDGAVTSWAPANPNGPTPAPSTCAGLTAGSNEATAAGCYFKIVQTSSFVPSSTATTVCSDSGNALAYKRITVQVSWPGMGRTSPVRADTLRAVGVGDEGLNQSRGTLAISVVNSAGGGTAGVRVTVTLGGTSVSQVTGDDGCLIYTGLAAGTYTATANTPGFVGTQNTQTVTKASMGVTAGVVSRGSLLIDVARSAVVTFDTAVADPVVPAGLPLSYSSTYISTPKVAPSCATAPTEGCADAVPGVIRNFFPESYTLKVGGCTETSPSLTSGADLRPATSEGSSIPIPMGVITVDVKNSTGQSLAGRTVTFTHLPQLTTGCTTGETYTAVTRGGGGTPFALPYGSWSVSSPAQFPPILGQVVALVTPVVLSPTARTGAGTLTVLS